MLNGFTGHIAFQMAFRHVGHVAGSVNKHVVPGLVFRRSRSGYCFIPLVTRLTRRIDVRDNTTIIKQPMVNYLTNVKSGYGKYYDLGHRQGYS